MDREPILALLLARREEAVGAMRTQFGKRLMMTAMNILNDRQDAEETVSDTYLAVWNTVPPKEPVPLAPFVYRVGRNLALKRLRLNTARKRDSRLVLSLSELEDDPAFLWKRGKKTVNGTAQLPGIRFLLQSRGGNTGFQLCQRQLQTAVALAGGI